MCWISLRSDKRSSHSRISVGSPWPLHHRFVLLSVQICGLKPWWLDFVPSQIFVPSIHTVGWIERSNPCLENSFLSLGRCDPLGCKFLRVFVPSVSAHKVYCKSEDTRAEHHSDINCREFGFGEGGPDPFDPLLLIVLGDGGPSVAA